MSVRDRIGDSRLLFVAGRLEGALLSVLSAVAGTSRKRYPKSTVSDSGEAFVRFLRDEETRFPTGVFHDVHFEGVSRSIASVLWKYVRCELSHEGELHPKISVDYGDFLLDKRGTHDHFTFSSELIIRLAYVVETAVENVDVIPEGRYDRLPEPIDLRRAAIIRFTYENNYECLCHACSLVSEVWEETGEVIDWLHLKAYQLMNCQVVSKESFRLLVAVKYVTAIDDGPHFQIAKRRTSNKVGVFRPDKPAPSSAMSLKSIREIIAGLQIDLVRNMVHLQRPHYDFDPLSSAHVAQPRSGEPS